MRTLGASHAGRVRANNQDAFVSGVLTEKAAFVVVCDGMGGANGGNIASGIAVRCIADRLIDGYRDSADRETIRALMTEAIADANTEIYETSLESPDLRGMGTTAVAAVVTDDTAYIMHVGDSRAYWITHSSIRQVTRDHSVVQEMVEQGTITQEESRTHPQKHFLTRALGVERDMDGEFATVALTEPGTLLVCTDGLTNMVTDETIQSLVRTFPFEEISNKLINTANLAGGSDNITVVVVAHQEQTQEVS